MIKSLFSGVTGLKSHNQRMDVIGNNIANVNTTGYKANNVTFKDVYYQTKKMSSAGSALKGGVNPQQTGYGVKMGSIGQIMSQSGLTYSDSIYDCALQGDGFFQVMDGQGNIFYTRNGVFSVDDYGNLTDANGYVVLGVAGDPTGIGPSSQRINLRIPNVENSVASATKTIKGYEMTISASSFGEDGNISLLIQDSKSPFAYYSNNTLSVSMDLSVDFQDELQFQQALNEAIAQGGVNIPNVTPLTISFSGVPANIDAEPATNTLNFTDKTTDPETNYQMTFTADLAGEAGNKTEINMRTSTTASDVTAVWSGDLLTITVPEGGVYTQEDIQNALNKAADMTQTGTPPTWDEDSGNPSRKINVEITGTYNEGTTVLSDAIPELKRISLAGGKDNFFSEMVNGIGMVKLEGGHLYKQQTVDSLESVYIDDSGVIFGQHSVLGELILGRIDLVTFENPHGLDRAGTSYWTASQASGDPTVKIAGTEGAADIVSGALEMSNVDLSQEFSDMIITQRGFQANSRIITVSDTMLEELVNLKR